MIASNGTKSFEPSAGIRRAGRNISRFNSESIPATHPVSKLGIITPTSGSMRRIMAIMFIPEIIISAGPRTKFPSPKNGRVADDPLSPRKFTGSADCNQATILYTGWCGRIGHRKDLLSLVQAADYTTDLALLDILGAADGHDPPDQVGSGSQPRRN
jgi:hypothetical protein